MNNDFIGKLHVTVLKAQNLAISVSDSYCLLTLDKQKFKTKVLNRDVNPNWNQNFTFNINKPFSILEVSIWNENKVTSDTFLGKINIEIIQLTDQNTHNKWFKLKKRTDKDNVTGEINLQLIYKYLSTWDPLYQGYQALMNKNYSLALRLLNEAINQYPEETALYSYRSSTYIGLGKFQEALLDAKKIIESNPNSAEGYYRLGVVYFNAEEYQKAEEAYQLGLKTEPDDEKCNKALKSMKKNTIKQQVKKSIARGRASFEKGDYEIAIEYFNDAIKNNPKNSLYYVYRSISYMAAGNLTPAFEDAIKIVQLNPNYPKTNPLKQGYINKEGKVNVMKKKRWFILKDYFIYYYNTSKDLEANGVILLAKFDLQKNGKKNWRIVTPNRTFELKCETEEERNEWLTILEKILNQPRMVLPQPDPKEEIIYLSNSNSQTNVILQGFADLGNVIEKTFLDTVSVPERIASSLSGKIYSKLFPITLENIIKEGILYKMGHVRKAFKKRYWILKEQTLYYFDEKKENLKKSSTVTPSGIIPLNNCKVVPAQEKVKKEFAFELITPNRSYILSAISEIQMKEWIQAILEAAGYTKEYNHLKKDNVEEEDVDDEIMNNRVEKVNVETEEMNRKTTSSVQPHGRLTVNKEQQLTNNTNSHEEATITTTPTKYSINNDSDGYVIENEDVSSQYSDNNFSMQGVMPNSESRYFLKFGLTPPTENTTTPLHFNSEDDEKTLLISKKKQETNCCSNCCNIL